jgi:hypothetical protein
MKVLYILFFIAFSATCIAQPDSAKIPSIDTDRPDQTESAILVPKKWSQFEAGFNIQTNNDNTKEYLSPTLLSKYGLTRKLELRLITSIITNSYHIIPIGTIKETYFDVPQIGAKVAFWEEKNLRPKTSVIFHVGVPGIASYELDKILFNSRLTMQHTLTKRISLGYNVGIEFDGNSDDPVFIYTIAPGTSIGEKWYAYIEAFGDLQKNGEHTIDGGLAYYVSDNFKLDISSGFGISGNAPKNYVSLGVSVRFNMSNK